MTNLLNRVHEPFNGFSHLLGALLTVIGTIWLVGQVRDEATKVVTVVIYGVSTMLTFSSSAALHLIKAGEPIRRWLRRADHASIYVMIAGTYTPFCYHVLTNEGWRWGILGTVWILAAAGVAYKLFFWNKDSHLSTVLYVLMGWLGVVLAPQFLQVVPSPILWLLIGGGVTYSIGAVVFALEKPNFHRHFGFHELWHVFVLAGSILHFVAVLLLLL